MVLEFWLGIDLGDVAGAGDLAVRFAAAAAGAGAGEATAEAVEEAVV